MEEKEKVLSCYKIAIIGEVGFGKQRFVLVIVGVLPDLDVDAVHRRFHRLAGIGIQPELADGQVAVAVGILGRGGLGSTAHLDIFKLDDFFSIHRRPLPVAVSKAVWGVSLLLWNST